MRSSVFAPICLCLSMIAAPPAAGQPTPSNSFLDQYMEIKQVENLMFEADTYPMWPNPAQSLEGFDLVHCGSLDFIADPSDDPLEIAFQSIAHTALYWEHSLRLIGYPEETWRLIANRIEEDALATITGSGDTHAVPAMISSSRWWMP